MDSLWYRFPMSHPITTQLICHDLPGFTLVAPNQPLEEVFRCDTDDVRWESVAFVDVHSPILSILAR
jgi:hypothetical protein